jgi:hypothetical protein
VNFVLLPTGFLVGAQWGLAGLCLAWLVSVPLAYSFAVPAVLRRLGLSARDLLAECAAPAAAALVMYLAVGALRSLVGPDPMARLVTLSAAGALVYFAVMAVVSRRHLISARRFSHSLWAGDAKVA